MGDFKTLRVWNEGIQLAESIYEITKIGAFSRDFGLRDQIQRASVSIPSNIAEGEERKTINLQGLTLTRSNVNKVSRGTALI